MKLISLNPFVRKIEGKRVYVDFAALCAETNYRSARLSWDYEGAVHGEDTLSISLYHKNDHWGIRWFSHDDYRYFVDINGKGYEHTSNDPVSAMEYAEFWDNVSEFADQTDRKGYSEWRGWDEDFISRHNIYFVKNSRTPHDISPVIDRLTVGDCLLFGFDLNFNAVRAQFMPCKADRDNGVAKYQNILRGKGEPIGFEEDFVLLPKEEIMGKDLVLVEGALDMFQANDYFNRGGLTKMVAFMGGLVPSDAVLKSVKRYCEEYRPGRIWWYLEPESGDDSARNIRRKFSRLLSECYDKIGYAPGFTFWRFEDENMEYTGGRITKVDFDSYCVHRFENDKRMVAKEVTSLRLPRNTKEGVVYRHSEVTPIMAHIENPNAVCCLGSTGDNKTTTAHRLIKDSEGKCKILFTCFNIDEVIAAYEATGRKFLALSSEFQYGKDTEAQHLWDEGEKEINATMNVWDKSRAYEELTKKCYSLFLKSLSDANKNNMSIITTHGYFSKLFYYWYDQYQPDMIIIDESFSLYSHESYKTALDSVESDMPYRLTILELITKRYQEKRLNNVPVVLLDGTGDLSRYNGYFGNRAYRAPILDCLSFAEEGSKTGKWVVDGKQVNSFSCNWEGSTVTLTPENVSEVVEPVKLPENVKYLIDNFRGWPEYDLIPKSHDHLHFNLNMLKDGYPNRNAWIKDHWGLFMQSLENSQYVPGHDHSLLLFCYKDVVPALRKANEKWLVNGHQSNLVFYADLESTSSVHRKTIEEAAEYEVDEHDHQKRVLQGKIQANQERRLHLLLNELSPEWLELQVEIEKDKKALADLEAKDVFSSSQQEVRKDWYWSTVKNNGEDFMVWASQFKQVTIATWKHGRGTNKFHQADNIIAIGSYNESNWDPEDQAAELWQSCLRGAARKGSYCLINVWATPEVYGVVERKFNDWDNHPWGTEEDKRVLAHRENNFSELFLAHVPEIIEQQCAKFGLVPGRQFARYYFHAFEVDKGWKMSEITPHIIGKDDLHVVAREAQRKVESGEDLSPMEQAVVNNNFTDEVWREQQWMRLQKEKSDKQKSVVAKNLRSLDDLVAEFCDPKTKVDRKKCVRTEIVKYLRREGETVDDFKMARKILESRGYKLPDDRKGNGAWLHKS